MTIAATRRGIHQVMWLFNPRKISAFLASRARSVPLSAHARSVVPG
jgi:RNA polymerase sigma-70 factor (ECF subfamily)